MVSHDFGIIRAVVGTRSSPIGKLHTEFRTAWLSLNTGRSSTLPPGHAKAADRLSYALLRPWDELQQCSPCLHLPIFLHCAQ